MEYRNRLRIRKATALLKTKKYTVGEVAEAVGVGVESRTSTPVRVPRDKQSLMHPEVEGLFPAGEGAGYAGGIISAALDGERIAEAIVEYVK